MRGCAEVFIPLVFGCQCSHRKKLCVRGVLPQVKQAESAAAHGAELSERQAALAAARGHAEGLNASLTAALAKHAVRTQIVVAIFRKKMWKWGFPWTPRG